MFSCCLSFDFDGMASWTVGMKSQNRSEISRGEYGATVGMPRVLEFLRERQIKSTFFVPGQVARTYPRLVELAARDGHEIGHHGWSHEVIAAQSLLQERRNLELGLKAIEEISGQRPRGYRSPSWDMTMHTPELLHEFGFEYDSSCMAGDYYPYYLRQGDTWDEDGGYSFGMPIPVIELPVTWGLDDAAIFEFVIHGQDGLASPSAVEEIWFGDFLYGATRCPDGMLNLTLHPHVIARGHRMLMLERLVDRMSTLEGVRFETLGSYCSRWQAKWPLARWIEAHPVFTGAL